jgi:hypothetical protein
MPKPEREYCWKIYFIDKDVYLKNGETMGHYPTLQSAKNALSKRPLLKTYRHEFHCFEADIHQVVDENGRHIL